MKVCALIFKTVVFTRANPGKKETTDRSGLHVNFIQKQCSFPKVVSPKKWYVTNIKPWAYLSPQKLTLTDLMYTLTVMFIVVSLAVVSDLGTK